jgi:hypothetical protein
LARTEPTKAERARLEETMAAVRPGDLYRQIRDLTTQLERMALSKAQAPIKPKVNEAFNQWRWTEVFVEATNRASRRY